MKNHLHEGENALFRTRQRISGHRGLILSSIVFLPAAAAALYLGYLAKGPEAQKLFNVFFLVALLSAIPFLFTLIAYLLSGHRTELTVTSERVLVTGGLLGSQRLSFIPDNNMGIRIDEGSGDVSFFVNGIIYHYQSVNDPRGLMKAIIDSFPGLEPARMKETVIDAETDRILSRYGFSRMEDEAIVLRTSSMFRLYWIMSLIALLIVCVIAWSGKGWENNLLFPLALLFGGLFLWTFCKATFSRNAHIVTTKRVLIIQNDVTSSVDLKDVTGVSASTSDVSIHAAGGVYVCRNIFDANGFRNAVLSASSKAKKAQ